MSTQSQSTTFPRELESKTIEGKASLVLPVAPTTSISHRKPIRRRKVSSIARLKSWAWRATALYLWIYLLLFLVTGRNVLSRVEASVTANIAALLSSIGFAPVTAESLTHVFKWGWFLLVIGFAPDQLVGIVLYIFFFPILALIYLFFHEAITRAVAETEENRPGLLPKKIEKPVISVIVFLLAGWFVLYGGSFSQGPTIAGLMISGFLFIVLAYKAFQRVAPPEESEARFLSKIASGGSKLVESALQSLKDKPPTSSSVVSFLLRAYGWAEKFFVFCTMFVRGRRGRERVAVLILTSYISYLFMLGVSAVLFWSFAIRVAAGTTTVSLAMALRMSASHFLPGITIASVLHLPWWAEVGPAATAWVLFVLYIGPAASMIPCNQEQFLRAVDPAYRELRKVNIRWGSYRRKMQGLKKTLP